ncbi:MAG TPA: SCO family protein [Thermoanaerobaculia bacterium]|nr:SCO family protein [Thermoanaerobaculia bacterium]
MKRLILAAVVIALSIVPTLPAQDFLSGSGPKGIRVDQRLNAPIPLGAKFKDESGRTVTLGDYFGKKKPVILTLNYFNCPMLCNMELDGVVTSLGYLKFEPGREFEIVTVSFDPRDTPQTAREKKNIYVRRYGRPTAEASWHFLTTSDETQIHELTDAVGFRYRYDPKTQQYAHGAAIVVLTPQGRISRYLYGFEFPQRDLRLALVEASNNKIGSITDQFLLICYHYDPATGRYASRAMNVIRVGSAATVAGIAGFIFVMLKRDKKVLPRP